MAKLLSEIYLYIWNKVKLQLSLSLHGLSGAAESSLCSPPFVECSKLNGWDERYIRTRAREGLHTAEHRKMKKHKFLFLYPPD